MPIDFYYSMASPPCRSVMMVAEALGVQLNLKPMNVQEKQHLSPEFLKINPQHTIPTIVDDGFPLCESRAIITYLANKYGKGSTLYPEDPQARALVDQRLYFDISTLYERFIDLVHPMMEGASPDPAKLKKVEEALELLDTFLKGRPYVAGSSLTLADYSIVAAISSFSFFSIDVYKYSNIKAWFERMKSAPGYGKNEEGLEALATMTKILQKSSSS